MIQHHRAGRHAPVLAEGNRHCQQRRPMLRPQRGPGRIVGTQGCLGRALGEVLDDVEDLWVEALELANLGAVDARLMSERYLYSRKVPTQTATPPPAAGVADARRLAEWILGELRGRSWCVFGDPVPGEALSAAERTASRLSPLCGLLRLRRKICFVFAFPSFFLSFSFPSSTVYCRKKKLPSYYTPLIYFIAFSLCACVCDELLPG